MTPGTKLGPYEILAPIGAGGMGEVYRARDTRLKREVALKVLPDRFADNPERLARFAREAEVLASLNHPNIATIYGVEERAIAMELVEGETLSSPLPIDTALNYSKQIADALEYAHERGVIHRDLKPANIKVTREGAVKLLDFGLAKAIEDPIVPADPANSPTLTMGATQVGTILGTAAYMSPEQVGAKPADRRSDIWSFGAVLYEMLSGKRAFEGESVSDTLASVLKVDPDWSALPAATPASIRRLLRRCLTRDRKQRLQAIGEARIVLENPQREESAAPASVRSRPQLGWMSAALLALALSALGFVHFREPSASARTLRYTIAAPENSTVHSFALSPDGRYVAIAAAVGGKRQIWLRSLDALQAQPLALTEDAIYPFWSPDSRYIGFFAEGKLKKVPAGGGPAQSLCGASNPRGGSWGRGDIIVFSNGGSGQAIRRVPASGGTPSDATAMKGDYRYPLFLPDGRQFLYTELGGSPEKNGVYLSSLDGGRQRRVLTDVSSVVLSRGYLLFIREDALMAQLFDVGKAEVSGDAFPVAEGVSLTNNIYSAPVTASEDGVLLYASGGSIGYTQLNWFDRGGKLLNSLGPPGAVWEPEISPDQKSILFRRQTRGNSDIWLRDLARATDLRITSVAAANLDPVWSPTGDQVVFNSNRAGPFNFYQKAMSGSGPDELLLATPNTKVPDQWSHDGRFLVYSELDSKTGWDVWVLPMTPDAAGNRKPVSFLRTPFNELYGQLSPDGRWMAYTSDESGQREVYVRPFPASDGIWRISTSGGEQPRWRADGKELFYVGLDSKMTAVTVQAGTTPKPALDVGAAVPLFETQIGEGSGHVAFQYDVTADGKRFVIATNTASAASSLTVAVNWTGGLKK